MAAERENGKRARESGSDGEEIGKRKRESGGGGEGIRKRKRERVAAERDLR